MQKEKTMSALDRQIEKHKKNSITVSLVLWVIFFIIAVGLAVADFRTLSFSLAVCALVMIKCRNSILEFQKTVESLTEEAKAEIETELINTVDVYKNNYTITKNAVFIHNSLELIKFSDICMVYKKINFRRDNITSYVTFITKKGKAYNLPVSVFVMDLADVILKNNKEVLEGKTSGNTKILSEKYGICLKELLRNKYHKR
jgi:hypothetical protein